MIYFAQSSDGGPIKIGRTNRLRIRLYQHRRQTGRPIRILAVLAGSALEERELHRRFSHLRVAREWFEPGADLARFIASEGEPWDEQAEGSRKRGRPATERGPLPIVLTIKGRPEWRAWLDEQAGAMELSSATDLIDLGLAALARAKKLGDVPPRT